VGGNAARLNLVEKERKEGERKGNGVLSEIRMFSEGIRTYSSRFAGLGLMDALKG
jgi:hypothetical protein